MTALTPKSVVERYHRAKERRFTWENHWQECYDFALPYRHAVTQTSQAGAKKGDRIFDGTASDAVDQLAASLMAQLTPPWTNWFGFNVGPEADSAERQALGGELDRLTIVVQSHLNRSNFAVEMHQCFLDLVTAGTASLMFEEAAPGDPSAFRFTAVPLSHEIGRAHV